MPCLHMSNIVTIAAGVKNNGLLILIFVFGICALFYELLEHFEASLIVGQIDSEVQRGLPLLGL